MTAAQTVTATARRKLIVPSRARPASLRAGRRAGADYGATAQPDWRQATFTRQTLNIDGGRVNVVTLGHGDGPPVVFLHGLGGS